MDKCEMNTSMDKIFRNKSFIIVSGHRGIKSLFPENTLLSFEKAFEMGVDSIEIDLNVTSDGEIVIIHDTTVDRTTNGSGEVRQFTLMEIQKLDASCKFNENGIKYNGEPLKIPTLVELCELMTSYPNMLINVEIKDYDKVNDGVCYTVDKAVEILKRYGIIERCVFTCFNSDVISYMYDVYRLKIQGFHESQLKNFKNGDNGTYSKMYSVGIPMRLLNKEMCTYFENMGIIPWSYCPDTDEEVIYSLECGARLVTANNPNSALKILKKLGYRK